MLALFITAFLTFTAVGPITRDAGEWLTNGITWLYQTSGILGGAVLGLIYAPIVITGMHNSFIPVETQLIANRATTGGTFIFPIAAMNNVAQGVAAFAAMFLTKDEKLKGIASGSGISAVLGITEPAMFGVNLKLRYPFYAALIGTSVASAYITAFGTKAVSLGAAGIPGVISIDAQFLKPYIIGMCISFATTFILSFIFAKVFARRTLKTAPAVPVTPQSASVAPVQTEQPAQPTAIAEETPIQQIPADWIMPLSGEILSLEQIPDPAFADGSMGIGFAIRPDMQGSINSPCAGTIAAIFPTKHAIGITADNGLEILIHIGIDTVNLGGEGFTPLAGAGSRVQAGQPIMQVDWHTVKTKAPSIITPVIFTDIEDGSIAFKNGKPYISAML